MTVFSSPQKYIQGPNTITKLGNFLSLVSSKRPLIIATENGKERVSTIIEKSFNDTNINASWINFQGECSQTEVDRIVNESLDQKYDCVIGIGGGKLIDAAKCVARDLNYPLVICPSLASNDGPCSAVSVMYTEKGECCGVEFFKANPNLVVVDSNVILNSPIRTIVAGMGDALSTYYEAEVCFKNTKKNMLGSKPSLSSLQLAELCKNSLYTYSFDAIESMKKKQQSQSLEYLIEANILLSGLGFESGGLALSHAIAQALTAIPHVHHNCMHGEMVAMGLSTQLVMSENWNEAEKVANYCSMVGLPVHFSQLKVDVNNDDLSKVIESAMSFWFIHNMPFEVTPSLILQTFKRVNELGEKYLQRNGDRSFIPK